jgi:cyanophycin synthetase
VILYEDQYIRGRASGDIIRVIRDGLAGGSRVTDVRDGRGWADAVSEALKLSKAGELVLMQADTIDEAVELIQRLSVEGAVAVTTLDMALAANSSAAVAV